MIKDLQEPRSAASCWLTLVWPRQTRQTLFRPFPFYFLSGPRVFWAISVIWCNISILSWAGMCVFLFFLFFLHLRESLPLMSLWLAKSTWLSQNESFATLALLKWAWLAWAFLCIYIFYFFLIIWMDRDNFFTIFLNGPVNWRPVSWGWLFIMCWLNSQSIRTRTAIDPETELNTVMTELALSWWIVALF